MHRLLFLITMRKYLHAARSFNLLGEPAFIVEMTIMVIIEYSSW